MRYASINVDSFEDAVIAVLYNHDIQAVVFTSDFDLHSDPMGCPYRMLLSVDGHEKLQGVVKLRYRYSISLYRHSSPHSSTRPHKRPSFLSV